LDVSSFTKTDQHNSLDHLRTILDYNIQLGQHGDLACNATTGVLELYNEGGIMTMRKVLDDDDLETSFTDYGLNMSMGGYSGASYALVTL
jgi:hypothetical protein